MIKIETYDKDWLEENDYELTDRLFRAFNLLCEKEWSRSDLITVATDDDEDEIVGVLISDGYEVCYICQVAEAYQRQGIGTAMVKASGAWHPHQNGAPEFWENFEQ